MSHALSSRVLVELAGAFTSWQGSLSRFCLASFLSGLLVLTIVPLLTFFRLKPFPLAHLRSEYWIWESKAGQSLLWRLSSQSFMVSDAPGSDISTVAWLCSYCYTFMLTRSCGSSFFLSLTRPNSDIRWVFNDIETWLFPQLSRHPVSSRVMQTLKVPLILSPYPASFLTLLTGHYSIVNSSKPSLNPHSSKSPLMPQFHRTSRMSTVKTACLVWD